MQLKNVQERLSGQESYHLFFTIQSAVAPIQIKKASFFHRDKRDIWFVLSDVSDDFRQISENLNGIDDSYKTIYRELDKKNIFWNLMNRNIRIPLHSIMGLTRMAEENAGENAALDSYLRKISMSGTYMNETIDDILDLRRIASNDIRLMPRTV